MAGKGREKIKMQSSASPYYRTTTKNKKAAQQNKTGKLEKKMFDPVVRKHVVFKEEKLK